MGPWLLLLFIVGDILGTGIYALTGQVAKHVGGAVWLPFLVAFAVALVTAFSYLELVTKYPKAAGAALYAHRAFGIHFITFLIAFAVMCSGITSASTASRAFAANFSDSMGLGLGGLGVTLVGLVFMAVIAAVNFRGVGESVKINVLLTGRRAFWPADHHRHRRVGDRRRHRRSVARHDLQHQRRRQHRVGRDRRHDARLLRHGRLRGLGQHGRGDARTPAASSPRCLLSGLVLTGVIYVLVSISAIALVSPEELGEGETPLLKVVQAGAPGFPLGVFGVITMFAVANSALINMLMASRLIYGMSREHVLPAVLGTVHVTRRTPYIAIGFTTLLAFALIAFVGEVPALGGTTALLLLCVFTVVNVAVLVLRKDTVEHKHFRAPTFVPVVGAVCCAFLVGPWTGRDPQQYVIAAILIAIGIALWFVTMAVNKRMGQKLVEPLAEDLSERGLGN